MLRVEDVIDVVEFVPSTDPRSAEFNKIAGMRLSEFELREFNYPRKSSTPGFAYLPPRYVSYDVQKRRCDQCESDFFLSEYDHACANQCLYHTYRKTDERNKYYCCKGHYGSAGCATNYHVYSQIPYDQLHTVISVPECDENYVPTAEADVFALDCEMCCTIDGTEITSITVVDFGGNVVYDTLVKPSHRVIEYNAAYSGINEEKLANVTCTLSDVQARLCSMFHSKTILIGHSLDCDFRALRLLHSMVVDTAVLFRDLQGRSDVNKRGLKKVVLERLNRHIQLEGAGHSSSEDAKACLDLILQKLEILNRTPRRN